MTVLPFIVVLTLAKMSLLIQATSTSTHVLRVSSGRANPPLVRTSRHRALIMTYCQGKASLTACNQGTCVDLDDGSQECLCDVGWTGVSCDAWLNECEAENQCSFPGGFCVDRSPEDGGYYCGCDTSGGQWQDGEEMNDHGVIACQDVDNCAFTADYCSTNATCTNNDGDDVCICNENFEGDGKSCSPTESDDLDDSIENPCDACDPDKNQVCLNDALVNVPGDTMLHLASEVHAFLCKNAMTQVSTTATKTQTVSRWTEDSVVSAVKAMLDMEGRAP